MKGSLGTTLHVHVHIGYAPSMNIYITQENELVLREYALAGGTMSGLVNILLDDYRERQERLTPVASAPEPSTTRKILEEPKVVPLDE